MSDRDALRKAAREWYWPPDDEPMDFNSMKDAAISGFEAGAEWAAARALHPEPAAPEQCPECEMHVETAGHAHDCPAAPASDAEHGGERYS